MTAALMPGAAVFASTTDCTGYSLPTAQTVAEYPLIVVGTIGSENEREARLTIESVLKGSTQGSTLSFARPEHMGICDRATLAAGQRVLLLLRVDSGEVDWPVVDATYYLTEGRAESANPTAGSALLEQDLVELITGETDQVVVPAQSESEGEGIEWGSTVLPVAVGLGIVFVIGLFLMRIWHRIDPS